MMKHLFTLLFLCFSSAALMAQSYTVSQVGTFNYTFGSPIGISLGDDEIAGPFPIGFTFEFFGNNYTQFYISSNGFISFDPFAGDGCCEGQDIPDPNDPNDLIAAAWTNLNVDYYYYYTPGGGGGSGFYGYETTGSPGNRQLRVTFETSDDCGGFLGSQIVLLEGSNWIEIHTDVFDGYCELATQGIENSDGTEAFYVSGRNADFWDTFGDYVVFKPQNILDDAGVFFSPDVYCDGTQTIRTIAENAGNNTITTVTLNWTWDGVLQTPVVFNANIPPGILFSVNLGPQTLVTGQQYDLKVWTSLPNGNPDPNPSNDTATTVVKTGARGTFTIGGTNPDFPTFNAAVEFLDTTGVCDTVIFNVRSGSYNEQLDIPFISGNFGSNRVIFQSETGDSSDVELHFSAPSGSFNHTLRFTNSYNITFKDITIRADNASFGRVIEIISLCGSLEILNCHLISPSTTGASLSNIILYHEGVAASFNNLIDGCTFSNGTYGFYYSQGMNQPMARDLKLLNCDFNNQAYYPINIIGYDNPTISGNSICTDASDVRGINLTAIAGAPQIIGNEIYLPNGKFGISYSTFNEDTDAPHPVMANNMITIGPGATSTFGMSIDRGAGMRIINNNIWVMSSLGTGAAMNISGAVAERKLKNNIMVNTGSGFAMNWGLFSPMPDSDNNVFWSANDNLIQRGSTVYCELEDWQNDINFDLNSLVIDPMYFDTADLHVRNPVLNKIGIPFPEISEDFDGELRNPTLPDLGADEFQTELNDLAIIGFASPGKICQTSQDVVAIVKNFGSNQVTNFDIGWSIDAVTQTSVASNVTLDTVGGSGSDTAHILLGTRSFPAGPLHALKAWTFDPNGGSDGFVTNDTLCLNYSQPLSGTYTVGGASPDFTTIAEAADALDRYGVCGPVTMAIRAGTYNEQISLNGIDGASPTNRITFTSETSDSSTVLIEFDSDVSKNYIFELDGADYIAISHVSFHTTSNDNGRILVLDNNCNQILVEHCGFAGSPSDNSGADIILALNRTADLEIRNCTFFQGSHGINIVGGGFDLADRARNIVIHDNVFIEQLTAGLTTSFGADLEVYNNSLDKHLTFLSFTGMQFTTVDQGFDVYNNKIIISSSGRGIFMNAINTADRSIDGEIYNNFVRVDTGSWIGIQLNNTWNTNITYNNVLNTSSGTGSDAFEFIGGDTVKVMNNVLAAKGGQAITYVGISSGHFSDYNDLYSETGNVGFFSGSRPTLGDWQAASGWDANSISIDPLYISDEDLHVQQSALDSAGTPIPGIFDDIDGDTRNGTFPDIGADEVLGALWPGGLIVYVDKDASGANNGTSWTDAFVDLQSALALIRIFENIQQIWIADGTYRPTAGADRTASFELDQHARLYGGFNGTEALLSERNIVANPVILSGDIGTAVLASDNSYHVVTVDTSCTDCRLDGLTIRDGNADGAMAIDQVGAGILSFGRSVVSESDVTANNATAGAAGAYNTGGFGVLVLDESTVQLNTSGTPPANITNTGGALILVKGNLWLE